MNQPSFNLVEQPWIKVVAVNGQTREVGLRELFHDAASISRVAGELGTQDFAVFRIALGILYRAFDFGDDTDANEDRWEDAWGSKTLPLDGVDAYLDSFMDRFDLVDPNKPFMQVPNLTTSKGIWKSLEVLIPDSPEIGNLFYRRDPTIPMDFAEAARWLVHCMAYDISGIKSGAIGDPRVKGGKGYPMGIGWCGWMSGTTLEGNNLVETLLLNVVATDRNAWAGTLAWETDVLSASPVDTTPPPGQLTLLTWQQRRIRLRVEGDSVTGVLVCNGDAVDYTTQRGFEMMTPWRYSDPQSKKFKHDVYMPRALNPDRSMWRSLQAILPMEDDERVKGRGGEKLPASIAATNLSTLGARVRDGVVSPDYRLRVRTVGYEYGSQMASFDRALHDDLTIPALLTADRRTLSIVRTAVARAQDTALELSKFANNLAVAGGGDWGTAGSRAYSDYFQEVDPEFRRWLRQLAPNADIDAHLQAWTDQLRNLARKKGSELLSRIPDKAWQGKTDGDRVINVGNADHWFQYGIAKTLPRADQSHPEQPQQ